MLHPVELSGNYLIADGKRFVPIGVNWVPARAAMQWPFEWDPESIETDFAKMRDLGFNCVRFDCIWGWFEPRPAQFNETAFQQFDWMVTLAHRYDLYLNPALLIGNEVGDAFWDIPWRNGRHPHADPALLQRQASHVEEFARRYHRETAILAWDLTDEPPFWIVQEDTTDAEAANWTRMLCEGLRRFDSNHLILCGTIGQEIERGPFRADIIAPWVDLFCVHPYPIYEPDLYLEPLLSARVTYGAAFETMLSLGAGKPVFMQEFGVGSSQFDPEVIGQYFNALMYSALGAGSLGLLGWCFTDADPEIQYDRAPYKRIPHETQFGVTDHLRNDRPSGREMRDISQILKQIDLEGIEPAPLEAGILVPHEWAYGPDYSQYNLSAEMPYQYAPSNIVNNEKDKPGNLRVIQSWLSAFILCREAGIKAGFPREQDDWSELPLLFAPNPATTSPNPICHLYTTFWQRVKPFIEGGTTLYASLGAASAISMTDIIELFGVNLVDKAPWQAEIQLTISEDFHYLRAGDIINLKSQPGIHGMGSRLRVHDAKILAHDQDGRPALVTKDLGAGHTMLCAYPIELMLGNMPNAFEKDTGIWRLYKSMKRLAGIRSPYEVEDAEVEVGCLSGKKRDYVILVNHSNTTVQGNVRTNRKGNTFLVNPDERVPVDGAANDWPYELPPFSGLLFERAF